MTGLMRVIVLVGFAHTLYLRVLFGLPDIPAQLYVHGTVLTIWFTLAFVQTGLIATDRTAIHRRLGVTRNEHGIHQHRYLAEFRPPVYVNF